MPDLDWPVVRVLLDLAADLGAKVVGRRVLVDREYPGTVRSVTIGEGGARLVVAVDGQDVRTVPSDRCEFLQ